MFCWLPLCLVFMLVLPCLFVFQSPITLLLPCFLLQALGDVSTVSYLSKSHNADTFLLRIAATLLCPFKWLLVVSIGHIHSIGHIFFDFLCHSSLLDSLSIYDTWRLLLCHTAFSSDWFKRLLFTYSWNDICSDRVVYSTYPRPLPPLFPGACSVLMSALGRWPPYLFSVFLVFLSNSAISFCVQLIIPAV